METKSITSDIKPSIIEYLNNGNYYYNYNITNTIVTETNEEGKSVEVTKYNYIQVKLSGQPNYKNCVKALIRHIVSQDEEFDLINSYNNYKEGLSEDSSDETKYLEYLVKLEQIKDKVKADFTKL